MKSVFVDRRPYDDVCIAFAARDTAPGKFTFYNVLAELQASVVFANDFSNGWYLNGTPDFAGAPQFMAWLKAQIEQLKAPSGRLFTLGSSMGAYAALRYGSLLKADRILALGPESELCIPLGRSVTSLSLQEGAEDISRLEYKHPEGVLVISGNNDIVDFYCASKLKAGNPKINVQLINNRTHVVAKYLNAQFGLDQIVRSFLTERDDSFLEKCERAPTIDVARASAVKLFNESLANRRIDTEHADTLLEVAGAIPQWSLPHYFCALIAEAKADAEAHERHLKDAIRAQPNLGRAVLNLAQLYFDSKRMSDCISLLKTVSTAQYTLKIAELLSKAYEHLDQLSEARLALQGLDATKIDSTSKAALRMRLEHLEKMTRISRESEPTTIKSLTDKHQGFKSDKSLRMTRSEVTLLDTSSRVRLGANCQLIDAEIQVGPRARLALGHECVVRGRIIVEADSVVTIGDGFACNERIELIAAEGRQIHIGDDCLLADVILMTSDRHSIFDTETGLRANAAADILIGDRVWFAKRTAVLKGAQIGSDSVVAFGAVVNRKFTRTNVVLAGAPAITAKENISWSRHILDHAPLRFLNDTSLARFKALSGNHPLTASAGQSHLHRYKECDKSNYSYFYYSARSLYEVHFKNAADPAATHVPNYPEITLQMIFDVLQHCNAITAHQNKYCIAYECAVGSALKLDNAALRTHLLIRWPDMKAYFERLQTSANRIAA
jgi:acetyltransferase-like isoleucine patch superfamily enzyme